MIADDYAKKAVAAGFTIEEAVEALKPYLKSGKVAKEPSVAAPIQYRDPADSNNVWSGRGRPAKWLQQYLNEGRTMDEFLV